MSETKIVVPSDVIELIDKWISNSEAYSKAHQSEAIKLKHSHKLIGVPSTLISAIVGTSIFAGLQEVPESPEIKWLLAGLSMLASALAALVTFYGFSERSTSHKIASIEYEEIVHQLQILKTSVVAMDPIGWRNSLAAYSQNIEAIGRRVDLPSSMKVSKLVSSLEGDYALGRDRKTMVTVEKVPRQGYVDELEKLFRVASVDENS